ncbi:MAG: condensation domain-containing protein, partial [Verrucomicrobia bacterium]|nr:condensation domain-containing protein [Verrucomicrobiota bacterium]
MKNIEDIYPISPMQELMLLHSLSGGGSDALMDQAHYTLRGKIDVAAFKQSWQKIVGRHPALRTAFFWEDLKQPMQVVRQDVELPFEEFDLRGLSGVEQQTRLDNYLRSDRTKGFRLSQAPLMRLVLFRMTTDESYFICSSHHLILDRWCIAIIHEELSRWSVAGASEKTREHPTPYRKYIGWVQQQDIKKAKEFWTTMLAGFVKATALVSGSNGYVASASDNNAVHETIQLPKDTTKLLRECARQSGLTLGTLFHGAWALVLNEITGQRDVVFGITVAGRPPDLMGVESIVGSFINNLPVRVRHNPAKALIEMLREIQANQQRMRPFEYVSLAQVHQWSELPENQTLFDTLLVQLADVEDPRPGQNGLQMRAVSGLLRTAVPLTVAFTDTDPQISIQLIRNRGLAGTAENSDLIQLLQNKLILLPGGLQQRLGELTPKDRAVARTSQTLSRSKQTGPNRPTSSHSGKSNRVASTKKQRAPQDPWLEALEQQIRTEWQEILGTQGIDPDISFFDLGGNSIQAARLHNRLLTITRKEIGLIQLFISPTIKDMALLLHNQSWPTCPEPVAALQPKGSKPPLFV